MNSKLTGEGDDADADEVKKMSERQTLAGNLANLLTCKIALSHSLSLNMLNNFCFHAYDQMSLFKVENVNGFF